MDRFLKNKKIYIPLILLILITSVTVYIFLSGDTKESGELFRYENSFENPEEMPYTDQWLSGQVIYHYEVPDAKDGEYSIGIEHLESNDSRFTYTFQVRKNYFYKFSCWIRTEDVGLDKTGANISVQYDSYTFGDLRGTNEWTLVTGYIRSIRDKNITVQLRLGANSNDNTGMVFFDDFKIEEMKTLPSEIDINSVFVTGSIKDNTAEAQEWHYHIGYTILFIIIIFVLFLVYRSLKTSEKPFFQGYNALFVLFTAALVLRLLAAPYAAGFGGDVYLFKKWGDIMASNVGDFYTVAKAETGIADYPPFYMYVLGIIGKIMQIFKIDINTYSYVTAIKLPPLLADLASAFLIYKICDKYSLTEKGSWMKENWKVFFTALYLFNPMVLFDSVVWGQMDSFLTLFILLALYAVMNRKVGLSAFLFAVAITIKPQGLFAGPVLLYYVLAEGGLDVKIKNFIKCAVIIPVSILIITLPYTLKNFTFLFDLYGDTANQYPGASVNAFNFFSLVGLNWVNDTENYFLGISYYAWGLILIGIIVLAGLLLYIKLPKDYSAKAMLIGLFLVMGVFDFSVRMHERYLFPVIALSLIVAIMDNSKFMLGIHSLLTTTAFFNSLLILQRYNSGQDIWYFEQYKLFYIVSAANVLAFILITIYAVLKIRGRSGVKIVEEVQCNES